MPNVKIYLDEAAASGSGERLTQALPELRGLLCEGLSVDPASCQFAILPIQGTEGQPPINCEVGFLRSPARTPEVVRATAEALSAQIIALTGHRPAIRMSPIDPQGYVVMR